MRAQGAGKRPQIIPPDERRMITGRNALASCGRVAENQRRKNHLEVSTMKKYQVIGGQYESYWYGESDSLHGARCIAARHEEYWDNWQGWHKPAIYAAEDVIVIESRGRVTSPDGAWIRVPRMGAEPVG